jgi:2-haloacid dehalogenase
LRLAPEPYQLASERLGVAIGEIQLIAAHTWDIVGALRAGYAAALSRGYGARPAGPTIQ